MRTTGTAGPRKAKKFQGRSAQSQFLRFNEFVCSLYPWSQMKRRAKTKTWSKTNANGSPVCRGWVQSVSPAGCRHPRRPRSPSKDPVWGLPGSPPGASPAPRWWSAHPCAHQGFSIWLLSPVGTQTLFMIRLMSIFRRKKREQRF